MANTKDQYLTRIETSTGRVKRLQRDGWEITATDRHLLTPNKFHLRKPNPNYDPTALTGLAASMQTLEDLKESQVTAWKSEVQKLQTAIAGTRNRAGDGELSPKDAKKMERAEAKLAKLQAKIAKHEGLAL